MSEDKTMQKMLDRFKFRITKTEQDSRSSFRGEVFIQPSAENHDGGTVAVDGVQRKMPYCIVPAHDPEYVKNFCLNSKYHCSEPFIPGVDDAPKLAALNVANTLPLVEAATTLEQLDALMQGEERETVLKAIEKKRVKLTA